MIYYLRGVYMFKKAISLLLVVLLASCTNNANSILEEENFSRYQAYYTSIFDNDRFIREPSNYELDVVFTKIDNKYRYDIIIDQPIIAMYDVEVMVIENDQPFERTDKMMPSFGVFESDETNMIPYQVNIEKGYAKGIVVSGLVDVKIVELKIMIGWKDYSKLNSYREFFIRNLDFDRMDDEDFDVIGGDEIEGDESVEEETDESQEEDEDGE